MPKENLSQQIADTLKRLIMEEQKFSTTILIKKIRFLLKI